MGYTQKKIYAPDFYVIYEADEQSITCCNKSVKCIEKMHGVNVEWLM